MPPKSRARRKTTVADGSDAPKASIAPDTELNAGKRPHTGIDVDLTTEKDNAAGAADGAKDELSISEIRASKRFKKDVKIEDFENTIESSPITVKVRNTFSAGTMNGSGTTTSNQLSNGLQTDPEPVSESAEAIEAATRRARKGKGKATDNNEKVNRGLKSFHANGYPRAIDSGLRAENDNLEPKLSAINAIARAQLSVLTSLRNAMACAVCFETLHKPHSLACGHVSCRKCLLEWFHQPDLEKNMGESGSGTNSGSDHSSLSTGSQSGSSSHSNSEENSTLSETDSDSSESEPDSDIAEDGESSTVTTAPAASESFIQGSINGTNFSVSTSSGNQARTWDNMEKIFAETAKRVAQSIVKNVDSSASPESAKVGSSHDKNNATLDGLRAARVLRFGESHPSSSDPSNPAVALRAEPSRQPDHISRSSAHNASAETGRPQAATRDTQLVRRAPVRLPTAIRRQEGVSMLSTAPGAPVTRTPVTSRSHAVPRFDHRRKNLVCPQCRHPVEKAPIRIFALTEIVTLMGQAEAAEIFSSSNSLRNESLGPESSSAHGHKGAQEKSTSPEKQKKETDKEKKEGEEKEKSPSSKEAVPGLDDSDATWGGLFLDDHKGERGAEKKDRQAPQVMRDREDGVRRCGQCNWEINEISGECEGCGRHWDLSEGSGDEDQDDDNSSAVDSHLDFVLPPLRGRSVRNFVFDYDRSEEESGDEEDEEDRDLSDGFVVDDDRPLSSDEAASDLSVDEFGDESPDETPPSRIGRRGKKKEDSSKISELSDTEDETASDGTDEDSSLDTDKEERESRARLPETVKLTRARPRIRISSDESE